MLGKARVLPLFLSARLSLDFPHQPRVPLSKAVPLVTSHLLAGNSRHGEIEEHHLGYPNRFFQSSWDSLVSQGFNSHIPSLRLPRKSAILMDMHHLGTIIAVNHWHFPDAPSLRMLLILPYLEGTSSTDRRIRTTKFLRTTRFN